MRDVSGSADIMTTFNPVRVEKIGGNLTVDNSSGEVIATDIKGDVSVKNTFNPVVLKQTSGSILVKSESGLVAVTEMNALPDGATVIISTTFNPIDLILPANTDAVVKAKTEFGEIESDFPVHMSKREVSLKSGQVLIDLKTSDDITVLKK